MPTIFNANTMPVTKNCGGIETFFHTSSGALELKVLIFTIAHKFASISCLEHYQTTHLASSPHNLLVQSVGRENSPSLDV